MTEKSTQQAANVAKIGLIILWVAFMYSLTSCGSTYHRQCKPLNKALTLNKTRQKVEKMINPNRQFIVVNNEIIIFENY